MKPLVLAGSTILLLSACSGAEPAFEGLDPDKGGAVCTDPRRCCPADRLSCTGDPDGQLVCTCSDLGFCRRNPDKCDGVPGGRQPPPPDGKAVPHDGNRTTAPPPGTGTWGCVPGKAGQGLLGPAAAFNVFVSGDLDKHGSDSEGRVAVGGSAKLSGYAIGTGLSNSSGKRDDLIVGGNLTFSAGSVPNGNAAYGGSASISGVSFPNGKAHQAQPIDFKAAAASLKQLSAALAKLPVNGTTKVSSWGGITLAGSNSKLNVFELKGPELATTSGLSITAPAGATVVINIGGTACQMTSFGTGILGTTRRKVLYNFHQAASLLLQGVGVEGSILAPAAAINFANGAINGVLVGQQLVGPGETHEHPFDGCIPQT